MTLEGKRRAEEQQGHQVAPWEWQVAGKWEVQADTRCVPEWIHGGGRLPRHRGDEGLRLLHGLEANLATSLQTPQEA